MHIAIPSSGYHLVQAGLAISETPRGVSDEAEALSKQVEEVDRLSEEISRLISDLTSRIREAIYEEIDHVVEECNKEGWNGDDGCVAVKEASAHKAKDFVGSLNVVRMPLPEVIPEPDGDIALEWHRDASRWLLLSFQADGRVNYACRTGEGDKATGSSRITPAFRRIVEGLMALVYAV